MVVSQAQLVLVVDVVVQLDQKLLTQSFVVISLVRTCFIVKLAFQVRAQAIKVRSQYARYVTSDWLSSSICSPSSTWSCFYFIFKRSEKEQFVFDDWTAYAESHLLVAEITRVERIFTCFFTYVVVISSEIVSRTREFVCTRTSYGVYTSTCKVTLSHVIRSNVYRDLLDRIQRDWRYTSSTTWVGARAQTKRVVEVRTVNSNVVQSRILTCERLAIGLWRQSSEVVDTSRDSWKLVQRSVVDRCVGSCTLAREKAVLICSDQYFRKLLTIFFQGYVYI